MLLNAYPSIFARERVSARKNIVDSFHEYFEALHHEQGSAFVQAHYRHKVDQGAVDKDMARFKIGAIVAILSNTIPASFWVVYHAVSDTTILEECRQEIAACCRTGQDTCTLDVTQVKASCSVLLSIVKEVTPVSRYRHVSSSCDPRSHACWKISTQKRRYCHDSWSGAAFLEVGLWRQYGRVPA